MNTYNLLAEGRTDNNLTKLKEEKILDKAAHKETRNYLKGTLRKNFLTAATATIAFGAAAVYTFNIAMNAYGELGALAFIGSLLAATAALATPIITMGNYFDNHYSPTYKAIHSDLAKEQKRQIKEHSEKAPVEANAIGTAAPKKAGSLLGLSRVKLRA